MLNNISAILGERLLSISEVSEATGISRNTIAAIYYRKTKAVRFETIIRLCDYLQLPMSELLEYTPVENKDGE